MIQSIHVSVYRYMPVYMPEVIPKINLQYLKTELSYDDSFFAYG